MKMDIKDLDARAGHIKETSVRVAMETCAICRFSALMCLEGSDNGAV